MTYNGLGRLSPLWAKVPLWFVCLIVTFMYSCVQWTLFSSLFNLCIWKVFIIAVFFRFYFQKAFFVVYHCLWVCKYRNLEAIKDRQFMELNSLKGKRILEPKIVCSWPSGKFPFDCQKIAKNLTFFSKNCQNFSFILLKKMTIFGNFF